MQAWNIVEELRATEERITRYTNNPYDGLMCAAANEIERLILELQNRDKCSYIGPMRDCPTHGESADLAALRNRLQEIGDLAASSRTGPGLREVLAEIERMSTETPNVLADRPAALHAAGPESEANGVERRVRHHG